MNAASWHDHLPGEARVQLDLAGLVTFYDTQLAPSLVPVREGQERWDHRVQNISNEDLSAAKARLEEVLMGQNGLSSGIDWATLIQVIVDRYARHLEFVRYLLSAPAVDPGDVLAIANNTQIQLRIMLTPYLLLSVASTSPPDESDLAWSAPVFRLCTTTHMYSMDSEPAVMTDSEKLILQAIRGTTREICRVVTKMWANGVQAGLDLLLNTKEHPDVATVTHLRNAWVEELNHLMSWLDWGEWVKCDPACAPEVRRGVLSLSSAGKLMHGKQEVYYLPTWPVGFPGAEKIPYIGPLFPPVTDEWIWPHPKCIRRVAPYGF